MTSITIDWQEHAERLTKEIATNHFGLPSLLIYTKDGFSLKMDARMILQIENDDNSIIIKNFDSFPDFVENTLNTLIRVFFANKEREEILLKRLKIQEELVDTLQKELAKYNVTIQKIMIMSMLMPSSLGVGIKNGIQHKEHKWTIKDIYHFKDIPDWKDDIICAFLGGMFLLLILLAIAILLDALSINLDYKIPIRLGTIISIIVIAIGIYQYLQIRKIRQMIERSKYE